MAAAILALLALACAPPAGDGADPGREATVTIRGHSLEAEVARTRAEQAKGLGERDALAWDRGMLFPYEKPGFYGFWMKDMRFDIDIVWIRDRRIVGISPNVPHLPGPEGQIPTVGPPELIDLVLEVPAGYALARGWQRGDRLTIAPPLR